jgi:endonuclease-3
VRPRLKLIITLLLQAYPNPQTALLHNSAFELLVATILSAQCTDVLVNKVTPALFLKYPTVKAFASAPIEELTDSLKQVTFFRNKAKNIKASAGLILEQFAGKVPASMEELVMLKGVARKTANVVLHDAFGINEGIVVDTHVMRLSQRLGFTKQQDPVKIEQDLMKLFDTSLWGWLSHALIWHGRKICKAKKPLCSACSIESVCPKKGLLKK